MDAYKKWRMCDMVVNYIMFAFWYVITACWSGATGVLAVFVFTPVVGEWSLLIAFGLIAFVTQLTDAPLEDFVDG